MVDETTITVPALAAARAVAQLPVGVRHRWYAQGATSTGNDTRVPSTDVEGSGAPAPRRKRGRSIQRSNARRFSASVHSSPAPPAK